MKPRLHRPSPAVQGYSHFGFTKAMVIAQHYGSPLLRFQVPQGISNGSPELGLFGRLFWRDIRRSKDLGVLNGYIPVRGTP